MRDALYDLAFCILACVAVVGLALAHCACGPYFDLGGSPPAPQHDQYAPNGDTAPLFLRRLDAGTAAADRAAVDVAAAQGVVDAVCPPDAGTP